MTHTAPSSSGPVVLAGEATEDWTGDARFYEYSTAADPLGSGAITPVPVHRFPPSVHAGPGSREVLLDLSAELRTAYPATGPALLASFVVLDPGGSVTSAPAATSELLYVLEGTGRSAVDGPGGARSVAWADGDVVTLPAGCTTEHRAAGGGRALLYRVTDAPLLAYLGVTPGPARFAPTRFDGAEARRVLAEVAAHPEAARRNRVSILLANAAAPQTLTATHTLWAMLGILPPGRSQRPHRHQSIALDLIIECAPGCYSLLGTDLDDRGAIVDPVRVPWETAGAFVTPPGRWHSHHNESGAPAYLLPVQDAGLHTYLRTLDIRFAAPGE